MDTRTLTAVCRKVYQRFPEVRGCSPSVQDTGAQVQLVFKGSAVTADGRSMPRVVRVVATQDGKITKVTTSR